MKKYPVIILAILCLSIISNSSFSQKENLIPEKGSWQLISNIHDKKNTLVQFYDDSSNLIYEERINGVRMNIKRKKTLKYLKAGLEKAMTVWNDTREIKYNNRLLANIIKGKYKNVR